MRPCRSPDVRDIRAALASLAICAKTKMTTRRIYYAIDN